MYLSSRLPRIETTVLLGQLEGIDRPVLAQGRNHVEMRNQKDRLALARAVQPRHQIALARRRLEHLDVGIRESRRLQACGHRVRRSLGVARRGRGVDFEQFLVDVVRERLARRERVSGGGAAARAHQRDHADAKHGRAQHRPDLARISDVPIHSALQGILTRFD